ncbi:2-oxoglutarate dehydrogenase, mitochondrial-like isoform X2 [Nylanderia fulva]|uniref:2-oxoglutarate dehydrogenase, mitochondrial-like isoform X2 n=1 Tax=Nylanderia fulva TaxID=613905 RepID=UPI0010FB0719|nr:2-oxoglutarate dehydrogenase, mitochondrial-like isoform X2 [Nylanderia fulva]
MYTKLQPYQSIQSVTSCLYQHLVRYQYWKNPRHKKIYYPKDIPKSTIKQFHKTLTCRERDSNNGDRTDNILNMSNSQYLDYMYKAWLKDQKSVSSSWDLYFKLIHTKSSRDSRDKSNSIRVTSSSKLMSSNLEGGQSNTTLPKKSQEIPGKSDNDQMQGDQFIISALNINDTIRAYQARGHLIADTDPLGIQNPESAKLQGTANLPPEIVVRHHLKGMTEADMNREFPLASLTVIGGEKRSLPLREILMRLNKIYCGHLGLEYTYIHDLSTVLQKMSHRVMKYIEHAFYQLDWLREKFEIPGAWELPAEHRKWIWMNIMRAVSFESFLAKKYGTEKRFGLEGCESFIPAMAECIETSALNGVETVVIGMAHRGRLNTLVNICSKPMSQLFTQFNPIALEGFGSGDVKYHLGTHSEKLLERTKKKVFLAIMANSSHLEAIDPVIVGRVRAEQIEKGDAKQGKRSLAILVHGDAAFAGQGVVYETMHLTNLPEYTTGGVMHIVINNQVLRAMDRRAKLMESRKIDWAMGECLAFLSLLKEGHHVRLSGQDVERGTFTQRIHIVHDQSRDKIYKNILHDVFPRQALYTVTNSSLSEYGVCGFELGYSAYNHNSLTLWEAQFGDFANTCQVILDCLLCSGQAKWGRQVGLVLLLPHGMEAQGPEHSSARLERFLQLCDDECTHVPGTESGASAGETVEEIITRQLYEINWIICNPSTPANLFHLLRRQILMPFRKPLILMTPKSLLRHPMAISNFEEMGPGTTFKHILPDLSVNPGNVKKVLLCTGKVYYDLIVERQERQVEDKIAIIRIEQLCPFPYHLLAAEMKKFPRAKIMWVQEEHRNQGAYYYVRDRIALTLRIPLEDVKYGGRLASAAPATGSKIIHKNEYDSMMTMAMSLD